MRKCSSTFDVASSFLTRNLGEGIKGPTINAIASSFPELLISSMFLFYFKDVKGFSAGFATIIGSSAFNIAVIPVLSFLYVYSYNKSKVFEINKSGLEPLSLEMERTLQDWINANDNLEVISVSQSQHLRENTVFVTIFYNTEQE